MSTKVNVQPDGAPCTIMRDTIVFYHLHLTGPPPVAARVEAAETGAPRSRASRASGSRRRRRPRLLLRRGGAATTQRTSTLTGMNCIKIDLPKINSRRLFSREYDFPKTFSLTVNQFSGMTYLYTIHPWYSENEISSYSATDCSAVSKVALAETLRHGPPLRGRAARERLFRWQYSIYN